MPMPSTWRWGGLLRLAAQNLRWRLIEWLERPDVRELTGEQLIYRVMGWQSHKRPKAR